MDETKDFYELPRFPINEKYGEIKRFKSIIKTLPFKYKMISPNGILLQNKNPPKWKLIFIIKNLKSVNCYSNEYTWRQSNIKFKDDLTLSINIRETVGERGRIVCSLRDQSGYWVVRIQF